ncbi:hypothetical protein TNCV_984601 [Trichonephila clavipes]|nr:hypothetical protein TNCV_984601 [Trichonephila clavipes]
MFGLAGLYFIMDPVEDLRQKHYRYEAEKFGQYDGHLTAKADLMKSCQQMKPDDFTAWTLAITIVNLTTLKVTQIFSCDSA